MWLIGPLLLYGVLTLSGSAEIETPSPLATRSPFDHTLVLGTPIGEYVMLLLLPFLQALAGRELLLLLSWNPGGHALGLLLSQTPCELSTPFKLQLG
jgi:hypothetical protein